MINPLFQFVICHRGISGTFDPQFQLLQIETCTPELIIKVKIEQDGNYELSL
jgi:hypothetical protein